MNSTPITFEVSEHILATIDEIATNMETNRAAVLNEALTLFLSHYRQEVEDALQADLEIERGETVADEEVLAWLQEKAKATDCA